MLKQEANYILSLFPSARNKNLTKHKYAEN